jgi:N-methylhydantoinase B
VRRPGEERFRTFSEVFGTVSPSKLSGITLRAGDVVRIESAGGGGFGDPFERPPALVLGDVLDGLVTPAMAARAYGVALTAGEGAFDSARTASLRAEARRGDALRE